MNIQHFLDVEAVQILQDIADAQASLIVEQQMSIDDADRKDEAIELVEPKPGRTCQFNVASSVAAKNFFDTMDRIKANSTLGKHMRDELDIFDAAATPAQKRRLRATLDALGAMTKACRELIIRGYDEQSLIALAKEGIHGSGPSEDHTRTGFFKHAQVAVLEEVLEMLKDV